MSDLASTEVCDSIPTVTSGDYSRTPRAASGVDEKRPAGDNRGPSRQRLSDMLPKPTNYEVPALNYALPASFKLSVIIPAYNEERTIREILGRVASLPVPLEIIVVDDCSQDQTCEILREYHAAGDLHVIFKSQNEGKGAALRTGFARATGDIVVVQDADLEYDPRDILPLLKPILAGDADVVYGSRFLHEKPHDKSLIHRFGNWALTFASNFTTGLKLTDMETCYKAFKRHVLTTFEIQQNRFGFEPEVTAKLGRRKFRVVEVPISYNARSYAEGKKIGVKDLFNALWCIVRYGVRD
ncbi:glycosyltransferase family 2 protein [Anatilimnocola sp. NA78]|uniref:glycosyltransferase family 2 protein n=1 Tax=Anatilimnocola sp. NA78 TaxID=3415683 RepID=UPI003CE46CFB